MINKFTGKDGSFSKIIPFKLLHSFLRNEKHRFQLAHAGYFTGKKEGTKSIATQAPKIVSKSTVQVLCHTSM